MKYNYSEYIGIPWVSAGRDITKGLDCWGIVWHIYQNKYKIELPALANLNIDDGTDITTERVNEEFPNIYKQFVKVDSPKEGDIILMRIARQPVHAGLVISHNKMIHSGRNFNCVVEDFTKREWQHRIEGFYRHKGFEND